MQAQKKLYKSRAERFEDGSLVDVSQQARANRFLVPVALTGELYADLTDLSGEYVLSSDTGESRLQRLLHYARHYAGKHLDTSAFSFRIYMPLEEGTIYNVRLTLHAGDDLEDVITIDKDTSNKDVSSKEER